MSSARRLRVALLTSTVSLVGTLVLARSISAQSGVGTRDSIQFAGVAYLTNAVQIEADFPTARALEALAKGSGSGLHSVLFDALRQGNIPVTSTPQVRAGLAIAFAFDDEFQVVEAFGSGYKVITVLSGQVLTFDFREQVIQSSFPLTYEYVDVRAAPPAPAYREEVARAILPAFLQSGPEGVFPSLVASFKLVPPPGPAICRVRIGRVAYDTTVSGAGVQRFGGDSLRLLRSVISTFSRMWVTTARQPLLPGSRSQALGQMAGRFSNGEVFSLRIPDPDYEISLTDLMVRQKTVGANAAKRVDATGIRLTASVIEPLQGTVIASGQFRPITYDTVPANKPAGDLWPPLTNSLKSLAAQLGVATRQQDKSWFTTNDVLHSSHPAFSNWLAKCAP